MSFDAFIKLMQINSYTLNKEGVDTKLNFIKELLSEVDLEWFSFPSDKYGNFTYAKSIIDDSKPIVGLVFHVDTVHKPEEVFEVKQDGYKLYGPGAQDMQGSIFVAIEAIKQLAKQSKLNNVYLIFNTCEEKGSPEFQEITKKLANELDYLMVYECAETVEEYSPDKFKLAVSRKGTFQQIIETYGPGGHSGQLTKREDRKNAITQAIKMMTNIEDLADFAKETTVTLLAVEGGKENTIIPEKCRFVFDARYRLDEERIRVKNAIKAICKTEYEPGTIVKDLGYNYDLPSWQPNTGSEEFLALAQSLGKQFNIEIVGENRGGWSDACNYFYFNPKLKVLDGFGPQGKGEHSKNEFIYLDSLKTMIFFNQQLIQSLILPSR